VLQEGLHLTPLRRQVLAILAESLSPLGAYAIIDQLSRREGKPGRRRPTVYRTLDCFFFSTGLCLTRSRAATPMGTCEHLGHAHHGALLLCEKCGPQRRDRGTISLDRPVAGSSRARPASPRIAQMVELVGPMPGLRGISG